MPTGRVLRRLLAVALTVTLTLVLLASSAFAAPVREPFERVGVALYDLEPNKTPTLVIFGILKDSVAQRPAQVAIPVPKDAEIGWVGEVFPEDPTKDKVAEFERQSLEKYDLVIMTIEEARIVQVELTPPASYFGPGSGDDRVDMVWYAHEAVPAVQLGFEVDSGRHAEDVTPEPTRVATSTASVMYSLETSPVAAGTELSFSAVIVRGRAPELGNPAPASPGTTSPIPQPTTPSRTYSPETVVVVVLAVLAVALIVAFVFISRRSAGDATEGDRDADDVDPDESDSDA